jgi:predicted nucleic acid-binding protein
VNATYLADTSAWHRSGKPPVDQRWLKLVEESAIALCAPLRLELLLSAHDARDYLKLQGELDSLPQLPSTDETAARAEVVQWGLVRRGHHRGPTPVDLLIAATAELNGLTLLHCDRYFDLIAEVTGQPVEWLAPRGTLD